MNEITKELQKRFVEANKGFAISDGDLKWEHYTFVIDSFGDVNYIHGYLTHEYFKFNGDEKIDIETQEQADEFIEIVANYFGIYGIKESVPKEILDQTMRKLTHREKLQRVYNDALSEIVEELEREHGEGFKIVGNWLRFNDEGIASLVGTELRICDTRYFECIEDGDTQWIEIDEVKVRKALNVAEELTKIKLPGMLKLEKTDADRVLLWWGYRQIGTIYNGATGKTASSPVVEGKKKNELNQRFGVTLKPEQGKEYVQFIAEVLGGAYDV